MRMKRRSFLGAAAAAASLPATLAAPALAQSNAARVLKFVPQANLTSLDPIWTTASVTAEHGNYVYETLFAVDGQAKAHPQMAAGYTVSPDGRTYEIKLRDGLMFHDGTPVRAVDCVASLKRWIARATIGQSLDQFLDAWVAKDDKTLQVKLKKPFPLLIDALAEPAQSAFIMPERVAMTDPFKQITEAVGSGPYGSSRRNMFPAAGSSTTNSTSTSRLGTPPSWYSGGKIAHFDRVEWHIIPDPATASAALQSGEIDWWELVLADLIPMLKQDKGVHIGLADPAGYWA